ncbi:TIGR03086 family metal-binding protein [Nocardiopsis sediminis]|uniref:TIGR03086 family metal-binding protein n=1 Tax=Nocardiopsis sediminis TaxID=1778267 RepID=A0ABV8FQN6_9ACTN
MTEISERYRALSAEFTRRVQAVPDDRWDDPSPCEGWTARDVLRHMLDNHVNMPGHAGVKLDLTRSADDDPRGAWAEARDAMQALLEDPARADAEYDGYLGRTNVADTVDRFLGVDLLVHGWDIARATGQDETLPADQVRRFHALFQGVGDVVRSPGVFGPEAPVPDDASEQDRFLAFTGRTP